MLTELKRKNFEVLAVSHAQAILASDFPEALEELERCLLEFSIPIGEIIGSGGGESKGTQRLRRALAGLGWRKVNFEISKVINGIPTESRSHEVDHVRTLEKGVVALEIEWNNKDPFFDRDLENFKRLHAEGAISVGAVITRGPTLHDRIAELVYRFTQVNRIQSYDDLQALGLNPPTTRQKIAVMKRVERARNPIPFADSWTSLFVADKFGEATTHWAKLMARVQRGVGNPCPLLLIGLPADIVTFDTAAIEEAESDPDVSGSPST
jgi:hypothetical protein